MSHQDWETIILKKKKTLSKDEMLKLEKKKTEYNRIMKENEDIPILKKTSLNTRKFIQRARTQRGYSQNVLSQKLCIQSSQIQNWENGKEPIPSKYISKLNSILKINIKKEEIY